MNRILYAADCLDIFTDEAELPDESVDLIYLDPPFNSNSSYNLPFKGRDRSLRPVEAFKDTWEWTTADDEWLQELEADPRRRSLAAVVRFAQEVEHFGRRGSVKPSLAAYLLNMAIRLHAMRRVLKPTGSIYLHCDPTASHYLKLLMDAIFGRRNFRNEIRWGYSAENLSRRKWARGGDVILFYAKHSASSRFNAQSRTTDEARLAELYPHTDSRGRYKLTSCQNNAVRPNMLYEWKGHTRQWRFQKSTMERYEAEGRLVYSQAGIPRRKTYADESLAGGAMGDTWVDIAPIGYKAKERLGYPTQKPLALLERIIRASSEPGDLVVDPFCGCGTTVHAAEALGRRWVGIDISPFSTGLIRERMVDYFPQLSKADVAVRRTPDTIQAARALAEQDKFEFEKWVCGFIGAEGMFHAPGSRGADGGVDGLLKFYRFQPKKIAKPEYAVVQVKGGRVSADAVRALRETVDRLGVTAGVMVCFEQYMPTVENQRCRDVFQDVFGSYPIIQGYSIEALLANEPLDLPMYGHRRRGAQLDL